MFAPPKSDGHGTPGRPQRISGIPVHLKVSQATEISLPFALLTRPDWAAQSLRLSRRFSSTPQPPPRQGAGPCIPLHKVHACSFWPICCKAGGHMSVGPTSTGAGQPPSLHQQAGGPSAGLQCPVNALCIHVAIRAAFIAGDTGSRVKRTGPLPASCRSWTCRP